MVSGGTAGATTTSPDHDAPSGFWFGTDDNAPTVTGSAPYGEPTVGGAYGYYAGESGGYWSTLESEHFNCHGDDFYNSTDASAAFTDWLEYSLGEGTTGLWFLGGPGTDPNYNGTTSEAMAWGKKQAELAFSRWGQSQYASFPILWMDIETGARAGWNTVYSGGSGAATQSFIPAALDRATFNGFWDYVSNSGGIPGVYSGPGIWNGIFGTNSSYGYIPNTFETTSEADTSITPGPVGWCEGSACAQFFGGQTSASSYAVAWQWHSGTDDYDQLDGNRVPG